MQTMVACGTCNTGLSGTCVQKTSEELPANVYRVEVTPFLDMETGDTSETSVSTCKSMQFHHGDTTLSITTHITNKSLLTESLCIVMSAYLIRGNCNFSCHTPPPGV